MLTQDLIQPVVKRIAGSLDYGARCDPHIALPLAPLPRSHRHAEKTLTTFPRSHVLSEKLLLLPRAASVTMITALNYRTYLPSVHKFMLLARVQRAAKLGDIDAQPY